MAQLQLLDIVKETLPNFDAGNPSDLIKAEKILKIHQKTNSELQLNDIENFIDIKLEAMKKYYSELCEYPHPRSLEGIKLNAQYNGMRVGKKYVEAFKCIRIIK